MYLLSTICNLQNAISCKLNIYEILNKKILKIVFWHEDIIIWLWFKAMQSFDGNYKCCTKIMELPEISNFEPKFRVLSKIANLNQNFDDPTTYELMAALSKSDKIPYLVLLRWCNVSSLRPRFGDFVTNQFFVCSKL